MYLLQDRIHPRRREFGGPFQGGGGFCGGFVPPWLTSACEGEDSTTASTRAQETSSTDTSAPTHTTHTDSSQVATVATSATAVPSSNSGIDTTSTPANTLTSTSLPVASPPVPTSDPLSSSVTSSVTDGPSQSLTSTSHTPNTDTGATTTDVSISLIPVTEGGTTAFVQTTIATSSTTNAPALISDSSGRGMTAGEIAAICIACISVLALSLIILRFWRKRSAGRQLNRVRDRTVRDTTSDRTVRSDAAQPSTTPRDTVSSSTSSLSTFVQPVSPSIVREEEKTEIATEFPQDAATIPSPSTSMTASSPSSEQSPALTQPSTFSPRRVGRAWDDPPPTPELHQLALETNQHAYRSRVEPFTLSICSPLESTVASPVYERIEGFSNPMLLASEVAQADLGELPEYSRN